MKKQVIQMVLILLTRPIQEKVRGAADARLEVKGCHIRDPRH